MYVDEFELCIYINLLLLVQYISQFVKMSGIQKVRRALYFL